MINNYKKTLKFLILSVLFSFAVVKAEDVVPVINEDLFDSGVEQVINVPTQNSTTSQENGFPYETLVKIPGLGKDNAQGERIVTISPNSLGQYLQVGFNYFIGVAIALAVVMIIYGGVLYATTDAISGKSEGKKVINDAAIGLALALGSWLILYTINPDLLKFQLDIGKLKLQGSSQGGQGAELAALNSGNLSGGGVIRVPGGAAAPCPSGEIVSLRGVVPSKGNSDRRICRNLLEKLVELKDRNPNISWRVTATFDGQHSSQCHKIGTSKAGSCVDIALNPNPGFNASEWGELCAALSRIDGISALNEASNAPACVAAFGRYVRTTYITGAHLHVNYTGR